MLELHRKDILRTLARLGDDHVAPETTLLRLPGDGGTWIHPLGDSLRYALVLLELAERSRLGLAQQIIDRVLGMQREDGLWPSTIEAASGHVPCDPRDTAAQYLVLATLWHRHHRRFASGLRPNIDAALNRAAGALRANLAAAPGLATALALLHAADQIDQADLAGSAVAHLSRYTSATREPSTLEWIDDVFAFAALNDHLTRCPDSACDRPVLARIADYLQSTRPCLAFGGDDAPNRLSSLLDIIGEWSTAGDRSVCTDIGFEPDFRAVMVCVLPPWLPTLSAAVHKSTSVFPADEDISLDLPDRRSAFLETGKE